MRNLPRLLTLTLVLTATRAAAAADEPSPDVVKPPPYAEFLVVPLRVHVLAAPGLDEVDCHLTYADVRRIVDKVNRVWHPAGVHWGLESVVLEPAARQERFKLARDLDGRANLAAYRMLVPDAGRRGFAGLHVAYLHKFAVNGVWLGGGLAVVQETARLREVEGGIEEPLPRVTAHELGHALGLPHRQDRTNLLASGTTGTKLNAREVETARATARKTKGAMDVAELERAARDAEAAHDGPRVERYRAWLAAIPGRAAAAASR